MTLFRIEIGEEAATPSTASRNREAALARENNRLPWQRDVLNEAATAAIDDLLQHVANNPIAVNDEQLAGAFWMQAMLVTGRPLRLLVALPVRDVDPQSLTSESPPGLYRGRTSWAWWLPAGQPSSAQSMRRAAKSKHRWRGPTILLWCGQRTSTLLEAAVSRQALTLTGDVSEQQFSATAADARRAVKKLLQHLSPSERLWATISRIEAWLQDQLITRTGDPAIAAVMTDRIDPLSNATAHYTWLSRKSAFERHYATVAPLEQMPGAALTAVRASGLPNVSSFQDMDNQGHGSRYVPTMDAVRKLADALRDEITTRRPLSPTPVPKDLLQFHMAFTLYSLALVGFAGGIRAARSPLPPQERIDVETGFVLINDKGKADAERIRLIWLADIAVEQIRYFRRHMAVVDQLCAAYQGRKSSGPPATQPRRLLATGDIVEVSVRELEAELINRGHAFKLNVWRHFLRTELIQRVPADVVHAFLGHVQRGQEPWSRHAGLDPLAYRSALQQSIVPLLENCGWQPIPGLA